jgi:outer membrane protein OmpA-like peptidoglycan-associated protein
MTRTGVLLLALVALAGLETSRAQTGPAATPQPQKTQGNRLELGNAPTPADMYCAGFITSEHVSESHFVAAGIYSPDQTRYGSGMHPIFIHGHDMKEGDRFMILRHMKDPNRYEGYPGQRSAIRGAGEPYSERGYVKVVEVQKNIAIAVPELICSEIVVGDIAVPFVERQAPIFRSVTLERFTPPNGKTHGRIIMGDEFDHYVGSKSKVYLDIGENKGLQPGDYLRATRTYTHTYQDADGGLSRRASMNEDTQKDPVKFSVGDVSQLPRRTLGDMIVLDVHKKSATAMILTAFEDIHVGDGVELMDVSAAPEVQPVKPAELAPAPAPTETTVANLPRITCSAAPATVIMGERSTISCDASSPDNRPVTITFSSNGGKLSSSRNQATLDTTDAGAGPIAVRATALDDRQLSASTVTNVNVEAPPAAKPTAQKLSELTFKPNGSYVDNRSKAILDDVALKLQQDPTSTAVLYGASEEKEPPRLALQRAENAKTYLTKSKGIDPQRIQTKANTEPGRTVEVWTLPAGVAPPK